jgi:uncharacterized protein (TIGR00296 family)
MPNIHEISPEEGKFSLTFVRDTLTNTLCKCINNDTSSDPPEWNPAFLEKRGVFVTLTKHGQLRGCIGYPEPILPLHQALADAAVSAALRDPRFPPVSCQELAEITIDITILTKPEEMTVSPELRPSAITIGTHGLIVRGHGRSGLLLPQVATEWNFDSKEFLEQTCQKAGLPKNSWMTDSVAVFTFTGQIFSEQP